MALLGYQCPLLCRRYPTLYPLRRDSARWHQNLRLLSYYIEEFDSWMTSNGLKLNADKTEFIWTSSHQQAAKINTAVIVLKGHQYYNPRMQRQMSRRADRHYNLTFATHQSSRVAASCLWPIRQLCKIRRSLSVKNAKTLVHAESIVVTASSTVSLPFIFVHCSLF